MKDLILSKSLYTKFFAATCAALFFVSVFFIAPVQKAEAQFIFGGPVFSVPCVCSAGAVYLVYVGLPVPGLFAYVAGTQAYENFNMPFATYALGFYVPGPTACLMGVAPYCYTVGEGTITTIVGSSL